MRNYQRQKEPRREATVHPLVRWVWRQMNKQHASQEDVAKRSGVTSSTMRKWRVGVRSPRVIELEAVINALGYKLTVKEKDE